MSLCFFSRLPILYLLIQFELIKLLLSQRNKSLYTEGSLSILLERISTRLGLTLTYISLNFCKILHRRIRGGGEGAPALPFSRMAPIERSFGALRKRRKWPKTSNLYGEKWKIFFTKRPSGTWLIFAYNLGFSEKIGQQPALSLLYGFAVICAQGHLKTFGLRSIKLEYFFTCDNRAKAKDLRTKILYTFLVRK